MWARRYGTPEYGPQFLDVAHAASEVVSASVPRIFFERSKALVGAISAVGRKMAEGFDSEEAIQQLSKESFELRSLLVKTLALQEDPKEQVRTMVLLGFLRNADGSIKGLGGLNQTGRTSAQSVRDSAALIVEASSLAAKSLSCFLNNDRATAIDAQSDFKLLTMSVGSRQALALKPAALWSLCVAVNGFYSLRLMMAMS